MPIIFKQWPTCSIYTSCLIIVILRIEDSPFVGPISKCYSTFVKDRIIIRLVFIYFPYTNSIIWSGQTWPKNFNFWSPDLRPRSNKYIYYWELKKKAKNPTKNSKWCKFLKKTSMSNTVKSCGYLKCYSSSSTRHVKSPCNFLSYSWHKICIWKRRSETILRIKNSGFNKWSKKSVRLHICAQKFRHTSCTR